MPREILVVEDDQMIRDSLRELLVSEGYSVSLARHGEEALQSLKRASKLPDVILLDLMMPVMDGKTFLERATAEIAGFAGVPVCILTAAGPTEVPRAASRIAVLRKPLELDDLLDMVSSL